MLRRTPLKVKTRLTAKKPMNKRSTKQKKKDYELEKIRPQVIERDHKQCVLCGKPYQEIHHISYRSSSSLHQHALNNVCCLCWECHRLRVHGVESKAYRELLKKILNDRYGYEY